MQILDPHVAAAIELLPAFEMSADVLTTFRQFDAVEVPLSDAVERTDHVVEGKVPVRVHRPSGFEGALPCVFSIHAGGYVIGSYAMDDPRFDAWCPKLGFVGVSVEYRLAPGTPYPGPLDDCYLGLKWTYEHAAELGIDPQRIGIMGVSAGGGLAAALALLARERGEVPIAFQLLDSPMLDDRQLTPSSRQEGLAVWSRGAGPGNRLVGLATGAGDGRRGRRLSRRRHRLRTAAEPGGRPDRTARVPRRVPRFQSHGARGAGHEAVPARYGGLVDQAVPQ
jgi:acetyl esterase/lipase